MTVARNLTFSQGETVEIDISVSSNGSSVDLSAYTANAAFRKHEDSANSNEFTTSLYANGLLRLSLTNTESANVADGTYTYSVNINHTASGKVTKIQGGLLVINPGII